MISSEEVVIIDTDVSKRVRNFSKLGPYSWKFSCTICGDSKRDHRKARFFIGENNNTLLCFCHNCSWSGSLKTYLQIEHPDLYTQLQQKTFIQSEHTLFSHDELVETLPDDVLIYVFFVNHPLSKTINDWVSKLKSKKIFLKKKNFEKILLLYKTYQQQHLSEKDHSS